MDDAARVLEDAALDLARTLDLDELLEKLLEHLGRLVPYDTANVMLVEAKARLLVRAVRGYERWGDPIRAGSSRFDLAGHSILGEIVHSGRSVLISDTLAHPGWQRHEGATHVRNFIGVPLQAAGQVIGLYALDKAEPGFFTAEHVRRTEALAPHAAVAIHNADLFERLQASEEKFRALVEHSYGGMWLLDRSGAITWSTPSGAEVFAEPVSSILGRSALEQVHREDLALAQASMQQCLTSPGVVVSARVRMVRRDGQVRHLDAVGVNRLDDPRVGAIVVNVHDVTGVVESGERIEALNRRLERQVADFRTLLEVIPIAIAVAHDPECRQVEANPRLARLMGLGPGANASLGTPGQDLPAEVYYAREGKRLPSTDLPMQKAVTERAEVVDMEMDLVRGGRTVATVLGYAAPLFDEKGEPRGAIGAALDITERKRAEQEVRRLAYHDSLTGLPNRLLFRDRLDLALAQARRRGPGLALALPRHRPLQGDQRFAGPFPGRPADRGGRPAAARRGPRSATPWPASGETSSRCCCPGVDDAEKAALVAAKVLGSLRPPFAYEGRELFVTASMGLSLCPSDGFDAEAIIRNADVAMYRAKEEGGDRYRLFAPEMNAAAAERLDLESRLRRAVAEGELEVFYQPLVELPGGSCYGMEALLRWRDPARGLVPPADFVPLAEVTGLIVPLGSRCWRRPAARPASGIVTESVGARCASRSISPPGNSRSPSSWPAVREILQARPASSPAGSSSRSPSRAPCATLPPPRAFSRSSRGSA